MKGTVYSGGKICTEAVMVAQIVKKWAKIKATIDCFFRLKS
jgi:hypothetical protein